MMWKELLLAKNVPGSECLLLFLMSDVLYPSSRVALPVSSYLLCTE